MTSMTVEPGFGFNAGFEVETDWDYSAPWNLILGLIDELARLPLTLPDGQSDRDCYSGTRRPSTSRC
jgi:hypothetical protein